MFNKTTTLFCTSTLTVALCALTAGCANRSNATEATASNAPGEDGAVAAYVDNDGNRPSAMIGWLTVSESVDDQQELKPTRIEYEVDPRLTNSCGDTKETVYFEHDSTKVNEAEEMQIAQLAQCLQSPQLSGDHIDIIGHADETGPTEYNRELGLDRANAVAQALRQEGIENSRIVTYSRGEYLADAPNNWDDRRVVIRLAQ